MCLKKQTIEKHEAQITVKRHKTLESSEPSALFSIHCENFLSFPQTQQPVCIQRL